MNVQLLSIQPYTKERSYEVAMLLGLNRFTFIVTIESADIFLVVNGDEEFWKAFERDPRLSGTILRLVGSFQSGESVELPIDLGEWDL